MSETATHHHRCPVCGQANQCRLVTGGLYKGPCWCESVALSPAMARHLAGMQSAPSCLCPTCLGAVASHAAAGEPDGRAVALARARSLANPSGAEEDFYLDENGNTVFTAAYHLKRGHCCGSGCRHCPFPPA